MALVSLAQLKANLRVEHNADDGPIGEMLLEAIAAVETYLRRPITGVASSLASVGYPVASSVRGPLDAARTYGTAGSALDSLPDYATRIEPLINRAIKDLVSDLYQRRVATVASESAAGVSVSYTSHGIPPRVAAYLRPFRSS